MKFYENGNRPLEIITSRQWFVKTLPVQGASCSPGAGSSAGTPRSWAPAIESWVEGLNQDWALSRQRYFGVPFPVWYHVDENGAPDHERPIVPDEASLPIDPQSDEPPGFDRATNETCPAGSPAILTSWTRGPPRRSSPQIVSGWEEDPDLFARLFPMDLRPQAHEIIRTWLFYTVLKSHLEHDSLPWTDAAISGFVLDPDRKKMSKSKGNAVTPIEMFEQHSADAVRYWAAERAARAWTPRSTRSR